ncbi:phage tail spike protein [Rossellomorea sp. RS05]|uniref:phage tail spike protein n=1 Tax=Rossellomorea sp. RS05 TaxID=3149166 RepID=UPI0032215221
MQNAYDIGYEKRLNELWLASFSLPLADPKLEYCEPFNLVEIIDDSTDEYIGLFRIEPSLTRRNESAGTVDFTLKHVFATLLDDVLFRYHQTTNWTTTQNIDYLLGRQSTKNWRRGVVDFVRYFHYKYENENGLLGPMLAIPKPFNEDYQWTYDTQSYPWTLGLERPSNAITCEVRYAKNMREIEREIDPSQLVNRIYPLGFGEGVNQLGIEKVNGGKPYLEDFASVGKYGLKAYVWADRRFEDAQSLKDNAQALLQKWATPKVVYKVKAADLSVLTGEPVDKFVEGALVRIIDPDLGVITQRIHMVSKPDITGAPGDIDLEIGSLTDDIATANVDIERKQQINDAYTQGATNLDSHNYVDNCDSTHPAVVRFFLPEDLVNVNTMSLSFETEPFRAYSRATEGGGATTKTTSAGGGTTATSSSGGGTTATSTSGGGVAKSTASGGGSSQTSSSGGGTTQSSSAGGNHRHRMFAFASDMGSATPPSNFKNFIATANSGGTAAASAFFPAVSNDLYTEGSSGNHAHSVTVPAHTHSVSIPSHTHDFNIPNHSHDVTIPDHTHRVTIPNHSHDITLPDHTHEVAHGIYELSNRPTAVTIKVDGKTVPGSSTSGNDIDIIPYLAKDTDGKVSRGTWHEVTLTPNGLGRINASIISRLFISSHMGGNF